MDIDKNNFNNFNEIISFSLPPIETIFENNLNNNLENNNLENNNLDIENNIIENNNFENNNNRITTRKYKK